MFLQEDGSQVAVPFHVEQRIIALNVSYCDIALGDPVAECRGAGIVKEGCERIVSEV